MLRCGLLQHGRTLLLPAAARRRLAIAVSSAWPVHLLGSAALRVECTPCGGDALVAEKAALAATLEAFRAEHGFGRGIAAPQIGVTRRFVALNLGSSQPVSSPADPAAAAGGGGGSAPALGTRVLSDPRIVWRSGETMTLWDDCMSLPWLLCKVRRHRSISVQFTNERNEPELWEQLPEATSELLQHELDHLDGVLITDRMLECGSGALGSGAAVAADPMVQTMVSREEYEANREEFDRQVDSTIVPTIPPVYSRLSPA